MQNFFFATENGLVVKEHDFRTAYRLSTGREPDNQALQRWAKTLPVPPMKIPLGFPADRLAMAGLMDVAVTNYCIQHPDADESDARAKLNAVRRNPPLYQIAVDLSTVDNLFAYQGWRCGDRTPDFNSILVRNDIDDLQSLQDWLRQLWNLMDKRANPREAWKVFLARRMLAQLIYGG